MTTIDTTTDTRTATWPLFGALSAGTAVLLTAIGTFWSPLADYEPTPTSTSEVLAYLVVVAGIAVATAVVFGLVVRGASPANATRRGLVLAVVALLSLLVFWTGLPAVLAGGALCCATLAGTRSRGAVIAAVLAILVVGVAVFGALAG